MKHLLIHRRCTLRTRFAVVIFLLAASALVAIAAVAETDPAATQETPAPDYSAFKQSYRLPFASTRPIDWNKLAGLNVRASINGSKPMRFQVDTGSTGVIVGAGDIPNVDQDAPVGSILYSSSGIE